MMIDFKQKLIDFENNFLKEFSKVELYELDAKKFEGRVNEYIETMANQPISNYARPYLEKMLDSNEKEFFIGDRIKEIRNQCKDVGLYFEINLKCKTSFSEYVSNLGLKLRLERVYGSYISVTDISFNEKFTKEYNDLQKRIKKKAKDLISNFHNNKKLLDAVKNIILDGKE